MTKLLGASWRTGLNGWLSILASIGAGAHLIQTGNFNFTDPTWLAVGSSFTAGLGLIAARDNKVTSEQAGAAPQPQPQAQTK